MPHGLNERFRGSPSAIATYVLIPAATSVAIVGTNRNRDEAIILADVRSIFLNYGAAATSTQNMPLPTNTYFSEPYYTGPIYASVPSGASAAAWTIDVGGGEGDS